MRVLILIFGMLLLAPLVAKANSPAWVQGTTIEYITVQPNGNVYVKVTSAVPDLGCTGNTFGLLQFDTTAPLFQEQFALLVAAHMAGRTVDLYVNHCGYYPYVQNSRVK